MQIKIIAEVDCSLGEVLFFFFYITRVLDKGKQKYVGKKSRLSPDPVKKTVGEIEAGDGGLVNIRGVLTLLF